MNPSTIRYHPYQRNASKTNIEATPLSNLTITHQATKRTNDLPQICKVGKYLLLERPGGSALYKAVDTESKTELACKIIDVNKFRETLAPMFHLPPHDGINKIIEILVSDSYAYVFFERSFGDLHSYVRTKRRLKEEEAYIDPVPRQEPSVGVSVVQWRNQVIDKRLLQLSHVGLVAVHIRRNWHTTC